MQTATENPITRREVEDLIAEHLRRKRGRDWLRAAYYLARVLIALAPLITG